MLDHLHNAPPPFNLEFRPGFSKALSKYYSEWSENNKEHSRETGMIKHAELVSQLVSKFPSLRELG